MAARNFCLLGVAIVLLAQVRTGAGYSSGAPERACGDMTPRHGRTSPTTLSPFTVTVTPETFRPGDVLEVKISAPNGRQFKGFLLQARPASNLQAGETLGTFGTESGSYRQPCQAGSLTHSSSQGAAVRTFKWTAPSTPQNVIFRATVVEDFEVFYVNVDSKTIVAVQLTTTAASPIITLPTTFAASVHTTSTVAPTGRATGTAAAPPTVTTTTRATFSTTTTPPVSKNTAAAAGSVPGAAASTLTSSTPATVIATTATTIALTTAFHSFVQTAPANSSFEPSATASSGRTPDARGLVPLTQGKRTLSDILRQLQSNRTPQAGGNNPTTIQQLLNAISNARRRVRQRASATTVRPSP